jgi:hypothetical protein
MMIQVQTGNMLDVVVEGKSIGLKQRDSDHRKHETIWLPNPEALAMVLLAELKRLNPETTPVPAEAAAQYKPCKLYDERKFHDWRWIGWPFGSIIPVNIDEKWCEACGLTKRVVNGKWAEAGYPGYPQSSAIIPASCLAHADEINRLKTEVSRLSSELDDRAGSIVDEAGKVSQLISTARANAIDEAIATCGDIVTLNRECAADSSDERSQYAYECYAMGAEQSVAALEALKQKQT